VLTEQLGWRSIFWLVGVLCLMVIGLIFWRLKGEWAEAKGERFDTVGSIVFGVALVMLMYGFIVVLTTLGKVLILLGMLGLVAFYRWEAKEASPILNVGVFRKNAVFVFSNLATLINYSANLAVILLLTLYLQYNRGFSPQTAGMILLIHSVCMTIVAPISGRLSDRVEPRIIATVSLAINCVLFLLFFFFLNDRMPMVLVMVGLAIFGASWGLFSSPNSNAVMGSVERKYLGVASATMSTMRSAGMVLSMGITMILFSIYIGDAEITPEYYPAFLTSMRAGFLIFAALSFSGIFAQLAGKSSVKSRPVVSRDLMH
jgi:predicted MFS family arabinose efflux permease